jgi:hypothetical protein
LESFDGQAGMQSMLGTKSRLLSLSHQAAKDLVLRHHRIRSFSAQIAHGPSSKWFAQKSFPPHGGKYSRAQPSNIEPV